MKPHLKRSWCLGQINSRFLAKLERILALYALPYDPDYPVICFDERPCFLIGDIIEPTSLASGKVQKEHYAYQRNGSCALLATIEPLTGRRFAQLHHRRTKQEYALFLRDLANQFPNAKQIRLVQDNLNTHDASAFYEAFPADEAERLAKRFDFYFTPKSASWLNMIEIEFSAISRLCLSRRIPTFEMMESELLSIFKVRDEKRITFDWQFSIQSSREKLNSHYSKVHSANSKFKTI